MCSCHWHCCSVTSGVQDQVDSRAVNRWCPHLLLPCFRTIYPRSEAHTTAQGGDTSTSAAHAAMHLPDLPLSAVQLITRYARGRQIAGTNKYARVCRQWRDADSSNDADPLQLYVNARHMSEADISKAFSWIAMHGRHVNTLVLQACKSRALRLDLFSTAAPSLRNLTWLEVSQRHSLVQLTPLMEHLPQLRHLAAAVDMGRSPGQAEDMPLEEDPPGVFLEQSGQRWEAVPDMQRVCPQLVQLDLTINARESSAVIDTRLARLLPARLQQLTLTGDWDMRLCLVAGHVDHLTALQQLTLDGVVVGGPEDASRMMDSLGSLQEVRVLIDQEGDVLVQLAPKLTACWCWEEDMVEVLPQLTHLTMLMLAWLEDSPGMPENAAEALAALSNLRALGLEGWMEVEGVQPVLHQMAAMSTLRSLQLGGDIILDHHLSNELELCTQLTGLQLTVEKHHPGPGAWQMNQLHPRGSVPVPQQLTGLRSLVLPGTIFKYDDGTWLASLSQVTSLRLKVFGEGWLEPVRHAVVEGPVWQVQDWPAVGDEIMHACRAAKGRVITPANHLHGYVISRGHQGAATTPTHWQIPPAVPGSAPISVFIEEEEDMWQVHGWSQPLVPCPHLPGVWELQGEAQEGGWSRSRAHWWYT